MTLRRDSYTQADRDKLAAELERQLGEDKLLGLWKIRAEEMREIIAALRGQNGELERKVLDSAMKWYRFTLTEGLGGDYYHGESKAQWQACKELADASPSATNSPTKGA